VYRLQTLVQTNLQRFIDGPLERSVRFAVRRPGLTVLGALSSLMIVGGLVAGRHLRFSLLPVIEGEEVVAYIEMAEGTTSERTAEVASYVEGQGYAAIAELEAQLPDDEPPLVEAVFTSIGQRPSQAGGPGMSAEASFVRSNIAEVSLRLTDPEIRDLPAIEVERGGLLTTVQDLGRPGYQRYGVPWSGAADPASLRFANRAVGNPDGAAGLECTLMGPVLRFLRPLLAALGGSDHRGVLHLPGGSRWPVPVGTSFLAPSGSVLRFTGPPDGMRTYLAFAGGVEVPEVLGSRATYLTAAFGGFKGRALRSGDGLHVGAAPEGGRENRFEPDARRPPQQGPLRLRISLGPQEDCFTDDCVARLSELRFTVSNDSNRMGVRLDGPILEHREGMKEIVSDANPHGTIQVPPGGHPIVMGADQGITGGYPKIGTVVAPDLARLAQALPGAEVGIDVVSLEEAREITLADLARRRA